MIKAEKNQTFIKIFYFYNRFLIRRSFHKISISKNSWVPSSNQGIYVINHSSWWDSLILFYLNEEKLKLDAIAMMAEDGLKRFPFFRKIGVFSVNPASRKSLMQSLNYACEQLKNGKHLFLFPQGKEAHLEKRPLEFFSGAVYLQERSPSIPIVPIVFYHGLFHHQFPEWYIHIGRPISFANSSTRKEKTMILEERIEEELDQLKQMIIDEQPEQFQVILQGKQGIAQRWENVKKQRKRRG